MEKERELYIKDMLYYVLRRWRKILIWMVVFAVLADGFSALKSYKNIQESKQQQNIAEEEIAAARAELSEGDAKKVEDAYESYLTYKSSLDNSMNYYNNSMKMQLDPNHVSTVYLQYSVNNSKILQDIVKAYSNAVLSEASCEDIKEKAGLDIDINYINELIEMYVNTEEEDTVTIIENGDSKSMLVKVIAADKETCEKLADVVEEKINEQTPKIQNGIGEFQINKVDRNYVEQFDKDLLEEQQAVMLDISTLNTAISNLHMVMSEGQKKYYTTLLSYEDSDTMQVEAAPEVSFEPISIKFIIVGLIAGAFLAVCWYVFLYVIDGKLKIEDEVEDYLEVPVLGTIPSEKTVRVNKNLVDRHIYQLLRKDNCPSEGDVIDLICANILIYVKRKNVSNIHITGVIDSDYAEKIKKQLCDRLQKEENGMKCTVGKSIIQNVDSLNTAASSDGVVFVEEVGGSVFADMGKEVNVCLKNNTKIIGAVVID